MDTATIRDRHCYFPLISRIRKLQYGKAKLLALGHMGRIAKPGFAPRQFGPESLLSTADILPHQHNGLKRQGGTRTHITSFPFKCFFFP